MKFFRDVGTLFYYLWRFGRAIKKAENLFEKDREASIKYYELAKIYQKKHENQTELMNKYRVWKKS